MKKLYKLTPVEIEKEMQLFDIVKSIADGGGVEYFFIKNEMELKIHKAYKRPIMRLVVTGFEIIQKGCMFLYQSQEPTPHWENNSIHTCKKIVYHSKDDVEVFDEIDEGVTGTSVQEKNCQKIIVTYPALMPMPTLSYHFVQDWVKKPDNEILLECDMTYTDLPAPIITAQGKAIAYLPSIPYVIKKCGLQSGQCGKNIADTNNCINCGDCANIKVIDEKKIIEEVALKRFPVDMFQDVDTNAYFRSIFVEGIMWAKNNDI